MTSSASSASPTPDRVLHITLADGYVRGLFIQGTQTVEEARRLHQTTPVATAALGRALLGTVMLSAMLKTPDSSVTVTIDGGGPLGRIVCVGDTQTVRGLVDHPDLALPLKPNGKLDVGAAVGTHGRMSVVKDLRLKSPYIGQTELVSGEIAEDFANYYVHSEQSPSLVSLGVYTTEASVLSAGGVLLQPLPGCPDSVISQLELRSPMMGDISRELTFDPIETLMSKWLDGLDPVLLETTPLRYQCHCSRERTERALISLGRDELSRMIAEEPSGAEIRCQFCDAVYRFPNSELLRLLNRI